MTGTTATRVAFVAVLALAMTVGAAVAQTPPHFDLTMEPSTIGPGSTATAVFEITNKNGTPVENLAFIDNLPGAVTIAGAPSVLNGCGGTVSAPSGGAAISLSGGAVEGGGSCRIEVDLTSSTPGTHTNTTGDLTSDAGNSGTASADLTVATDRPGITKSFSPAAVFFGERSTLTLTVDNVANVAGASNLSVTDSLPTGMVIASPSNATTDCGGGNLTAVAGSTSLSYSPSFFGDATVAAGASCSVTVDVTVSSVGTVVNKTGELTSTPFPTGTSRSSGFASASVDVSFASLDLSKSFTNDPAAPGGTVDLEFTVLNRDRRSAASDLTFTDDLGAMLAGATALGLPASGVCGTGSSLTGTSVLTLSGGNLPPEGSCTFSVTVSIPSTAGTGNYVNTTSAISGNLDGSPTTGAVATDVLFVAPAPTLTKTFVDDPVGGGSSVSLEFTITNNSSTSSATDIAFEDVFVTELPTASSIPADDFCGVGSTATYTPLVNPAGSDAIPAKLVVSGANLAPSASCTFSVSLDVAAGAAGGSYPNTTSAITAMVDGELEMGPPASDDLLIVEAPRLDKLFTDDPVAPGDTVTLQFTLSHSEEAPDTATNVAFSDDLSAVLSGLVATGLPASDVCGAGSQLSGTGNISLTGGTLAPGEQCSFSVSLQVPATAPAGAHTNTTSNTMADVLGVPTTGKPATDDLQIAGLELTKTFTNDPVLPGAPVNLSFTLTNTSPTSNATAITFSDDVNDTVSGMTISTALPIADACGTGSSLTSLGASFLLLTGGTLDAGESCTFAVDLLVPAGTEANFYDNTTSSVQATIDGSTTFFDPASDTLEVDDSLLSLSKEFTDDPVSPGSSVNLRFSISNQSSLSAVTAIAFTDDLDAVISGMTATGLPLSACGGTVSGTDVISLAGGALAPGASCTFDVAIAVPASAPIGSTATNVTSAISGDLGGLPVGGDPAVDTLTINAISFTKSFGGDVVAGDTAELTFNISNLSSGSSVAALRFSDDVDAMVSGATPVGLPVTDVCGAGSQLVDLGGAGIGLLDGALPAGGSCTFSVDLDIPVGTQPGAYLNVTSDLTVQGEFVAPPATATLTVLEPNSAPIVDPPLVVPSPSDEGSSTIVSATFTDEDSTSWSCWVDYGDGSGVQAGTVSGMTCTGPAHTYADDDVYVVSVEVSDFSLSTVELTKHQVNNVAPTIVATSNSADDCGATEDGAFVDVSADFTDPGFDSLGSLEEFSMSTIDWGDGTVEAANVTYTPGDPMSLTTGTISGSHVYANGGAYTITLRVQDDDGGFSEKTIVALVTGAGVLGSTAQVIGTPLQDNLNIKVKNGRSEAELVRQASRGGQVLNVLGWFLDSGGVDLPLAGVDTLLVMTCEANDQITINSNVNLIEFLDGGPGDDHMRAGSGVSELYGREGDDHLWAEGSAGDALYGGPGDDKLFGEDGDDLLAGGDGEDDLKGRKGDDTLYGEAGDDSLKGDQGDDFLDGGIDVDSCNGGQGSNTLVNCE